ncbi:hypothetical protein J3R83DRAFT_7783 [Lanmaoa asiatica]|nr:hypothetical protein J3R83DRAFT_7783 [Lanmaoa asiatica]
MIAGSRLVSHPPKKDMMWSLEDTLVLAGLRSLRVVFLLTLGSFVLLSGGKEKDKQKGEGKGVSRVEDTGKGRTPPAQDADDDEDAPQQARPPKPKPHLLQSRPNVRTAQSEVEVEKQPPAQTSKTRRRRAKGMTIGSDSDSDPHSDTGEGEGEASEASVPPRRTAGAGSMTPVKSGMKPSPRFKSKSRPKSVLSGENGDEVWVVTAESRMGTGKQQKEVAKLTHNGKVVAKQKEKEKKKEGRKEGDGKGHTPLSFTYAFTIANLTRYEEPAYAKAAVICPRPICARGLFFATDRAPCDGGRGRARR